MSWQKKARLALAVFVIVFAAIVAVALWQRKQEFVQVEQVPQREDPQSLAETRGAGVFEHYTKDGKVVARIRFTGEKTYPDGRSTLQGVTVELPDRSGRTIVITGSEAEITGAKGREIATAHITGDVKLTTSDGIEVTATEATYNDSEGMLRVPGPVAFERDRMQGTGVGATYDRGRDVLWLLEQAHVTVAPDDQGEGALDAVAASAGLARSEHYLRLIKDARITAQGRTVEGDDVTIQLTEDDKRVQMVQLRGNSRITGSGASGPQHMSARDIDLTYGEDGQSLQFAKLIENAVVQLPRVGTSPGRRVAGNAIDIAMAPDGTTVTNLNASGKVQVDLPAEGDLPAKRIRSELLVAEGAPGAGLQQATFAENVEYRETRAARAELPAVDRTARALKLVVVTQPGLGALQQADFRGNVHFTDGPDLTADAPRALYRVDEDRIDLSPGDGDIGPTPNVADGQMSIDARNIELTVSGRQLKADTKVRSSMQPRKAGAPAANGGNAARVPSMLKQDEPVNVTANRLEYDGSGSLATYSGNALLWQGDTSITGDTITVDDKNGNLAAQGTVRTEIAIEDTDPKTKQKKSTRTNGRAESFVYDDAKRQATYTTGASIAGLQGDLAADRIELFLKEKNNELERIEAYGTVVSKEGNRTFTGDRFTYTAADERMVMIGKPATAVDLTPPNCSKTVATVLIHDRATGLRSGEGKGQPMRTDPIPCTAGRPR
jgi:lipopolysaccharide transport protein LptA